MALSYDEWKKQKKAKTTESAEPAYASGGNALSYDEWKKRKSGASEETSDGVKPVASSVSERTPYYSFDRKAYDNDIMALSLDVADREMELRPYLDHYNAVTTELTEIDARLGQIKADTDNLFTQYMASPSDELYSQYTAGAQAYNDLANQYNAKLEETRQMEAEYGNSFAQYQNAYSAYEAKRGEYDTWKSTVRSKAEIESEMEDVLRQMNRKASAANAADNANPSVDYMPSDVGNGLNELETKYRLLQEELGYAEKFKSNAAFDKYGDMDAETLEMLLSEAEKKKKAAEDAQQRNVRRRNGEDVYSARKEIGEEASAIEDLKAVLEYKRGQQYEDVPNGEDFAEKSQYVSTQKKAVPMGGVEYDPLSPNNLYGENAEEYFGDIRHDYINGNEDAVRLVEANEAVKKLIGDESDFYRTMTQDEIDKYNALYNDDPTEGDKYLDYIQSNLYKRYREQLEEQARETARENPFGASAGTVVKNPLKAIAYANQIKGFFTDEEIDPNDPAYKWSYTNTAVRDEVSKNFGEVGSFLYQTGMSMADFLYNAAITGGLGGEALLGEAGAKAAQNLTLAIMGTEAAADTVQQLKERGLSDGDAFLVGTVNGLVEIITEKLSLETLLDKSAWMKNGTVNYLLKNTIAEGSEEAAADILDTIADVVFLGKDSEWNENIQSYMADGMSYKDAYAQVASDFVNETFTDALGGALSGFAMGAGGTAMNYTSMLNTGAKKWYEFVGKVEKAKNSAQIEMLAQKVMDETDGASPVNQYAVNILNDIRKGNELNDFEVGVVKNTANWFEEHNVKGFENFKAALAEKARLNKDQIKNRIEELEKSETANEFDYKATWLGLDVYSDTYKQFKAEVQALQSVDKNLVVELEDSKENYDGYRAKGSNTIKININTKNPLSQVLSHEFTHYIEETDPEAYGKIRKIAVNYLKAAYDYDKYVNEVKRLYKDVMDTNNIDAVEGEIVAKFVERNILQNPNALTSLTRDRSLAETIANVAGRISDGIKGNSVARNVTDGVRNVFEEAIGKKQGREVKQSKRAQKRQAKTEARLEKKAAQYDEQAAERKKTQDEEEARKEKARKEQSKALDKEREELENQFTIGAITEQEYEDRLASIEAELESLGVDLEERVRQQDAEEEAAIKAKREQFSVDGTPYDVVFRDDIETTLVENGEPKRQFSLSEPVEVGTKLLALHNLTEQNLLDATKLGGFPMPSIAVVKAEMGHSKFGEITVVFPRSTVDPAANRRNKLYGGDAYTPNIPQFDHKIDTKVTREIADRLKDDIGDDLYSTFPFATDQENVEDALRGNDGTFAGSYAKHPAMRLAFLKENGMPFDAPMMQKKYATDVDVLQKINETLDANELYMGSWEAMMAAEPQIRDILREKARKKYANVKSLDKLVEVLYGEPLTYSKMEPIIRDARAIQTNGIENVVDQNAVRNSLDTIFEDESISAEYKKWLEKLGEGVIEKTGIRNDVDLYTPMGNRRSFEALHWEATLENIVKAMQLGEDKGIGGLGGSIVGAATRNYASVEEAREDAGRLYMETQEEFEAAHRQFNTRLFEIADRIKRNGDSWDVENLLCEAAARATSKQRMAAYLEKECRGYYDYTEDVADDLWELIEDVRKMPTGYFEAKPHRAIRMDEALAYVIPDNASDRLKTRLKNSNVNVVEYEHDNEEDRLAKVQSVNGAQFSISDQTDSDGNMLTEAQAEYFANSKIRDAEGNLLVVYHGTPTGGFTVFKNDLNFFTANREYAERYENASASSYYRVMSENRTPQLYAGYLNIEKPFTVTDADARRIFINEYVRGGNALGISPYMQDFEIEDAIRDGIDWTEADNLKEFLDEAGYDYDGIIVNEGGDGGYGQEVSQRGNSYIAFNSNQFKNTDNYNPTESEDIRYSITEEQDRDYMAAVNAGDMETAQTMVDEAARAAGYDSPRLYHGTKAFGFTEFDLSLLDDRRSIFLTDNPNVAATYSGILGTRGIAETVNGEYEKTRGNYSVYAKLGKTFEVNANGDEWRRISRWANTLQATPDNTYVDEDENAFYLVDSRTGDVADGGVIDKTDENRDRRKDLIHYALISKANNVLHIKLEGRNSTRDVSELAKKYGYDSVLFRDLHDSGIYTFNNAPGWEDTTSDVYIIFNPNDVKSADPVTYDANGDVIPLSERFNTANRDIRYSRSMGTNTDENQYGLDLGSIGTMTNEPEYKLSEGETKLISIAEKAAKTHALDSSDWSALLRLFSDQKAGYIERIANGDSEARSDLNKMLNQITDRDTLVNIGYLPWEAVRQYSKYAKYKRAYELYRGIVDERIGKLIGGRVVGMQARRYTVGEIRDMFDSLNSNKDLAALADKVFPVCEKLGTYAEGTNRLQINGRSTIGGRAYTGKTDFNVKYFNSPRWTDQRKAEVLLHEMIHEATVYMMREYKTESSQRSIASRVGYQLKGTQSLTQEQYEACETLDRIYNSLLGDAELKNEYGMTDNLEFIAELSNPTFREKLERKNVLQRIIDAIKKLFGIETKNALDASSRALDYLLETYDPQLFRYHARINGMRDVQYSEEEQNADKYNAQYSISVDDPLLLDYLNGQDYITTYKSMIVGEDGKLHSPMASKINGQYENAYELGEWYQAVEHPELIKVKYNGKYYDANERPELINADGSNLFFRLKKDDGSTVDARYNPYEHSSNTVFNDQFKGAYKRPNLVTVEMRIPKSEEESGYKAQYAKDAVGWTDWKSGSVSSELAKNGINRRVFLSRYAMPVRIVPDAEVAQMYRDAISGTDIVVPKEVVTPSLREELENIGVPIKYSISDDRVMLPTEDTQYSFSDEDVISDLRTLYNEKRVDINKLPEKSRPYVLRGIKTFVDHTASAIDLRKDGVGVATRYAFQLAEQYLRTGTITDEQIDTAFDTLYDNTELPDNDYWNEYKGLKKYLRETPISISEQDRSNIDWKQFRQDASGKLRINLKEGRPVDQVYAELSDENPGLFPPDVIHASDQIRVMLQVAQGIVKGTKTLEEEYGGEHREYAYDEFKAAIRDLEAELNSASRFMKKGDSLGFSVENFFPESEERNEAAEKLANEKHILTPEEAKEYYKELKPARRAYEKVKRQFPLTDSDQQILYSILMGEINLEHVDPSKHDVKAIKRNLDARRRFYELDRALRDYKKSIREEYMKPAEKYADEFINFKDKSSLAYMRETMERNIEDIAPTQEIADDINRTYFKPIHDNEAERTRFIQKYVDRIKALNLSEKVARGETMSEAAAVQFLGEAEDNIRVINERKLVSRGGHSLREWHELIGEMWDDNPTLAAKEGKIREAIKEFHKIYDELFEQANEVYIRNGYAPIEYRAGYFPHFNTEGEGFVQQIAKRLGINTDVTELPTAINGLTHTFKPGVTWLGNKMERKGYQTEYNALLGFDKYIRGISDVIYHTEDLQKLRALAYQIRYQSTDEAIRDRVDAINRDTSVPEEERYARVEEIFKDAPYALSNFVKELDEYTNILANKKSKWDRTMEDFLGRKAYNVMKWLDSNVGSNMVGGNLSTAFTNFIPLTQLHGYVSAATILNAGIETMRNARGDADGFIDRSTFLTNRFGADTLSKTKVQRAGEIASMPMEIIDAFTANVVVRSLYNDALKRGLAEDDAMSYADAKAARIMAGRSKGEMPTLFAATNPIFKMATKFQLEVNNQFSDAFKDLPKAMRREKLGKAAMMLFNYWLSAWLFNELYEMLMGRRAAWDVVDVLNNFVGDVTGKKLPNITDLALGYDDFDTERKGIGKAIGNAASDVIEDAPFSSLWGTVGKLTGQDWLSDAGGRIPISSAIPDFSKLGEVAEMSPEKRTKYLVEDIAVPMMYVIAPFGVNQLAKTTKGALALSQGGSYSYDKDSNAKLQYPVNTENPLNWMRLLLFGRNADPYARKWVDSGFDTMTKKETQEYENLRNKGWDAYDAYDRIMLPR